MIKDSKQHLSETRESYSQHFKIAFKIGFIMIIGGIQAIFHAFVPGILKTSASDKIKKLSKYIYNRN